jgi:hypothetical protein
VAGAAKGVLKQTSLGHGADDWIENTSDILEAGVLACESFFRLVRWVGWQNSRRASIERQGAHNEAQTVFAGSLIAGAHASSSIATGVSGVCSCGTIVLSESVNSSSYRSCGRVQML